MDSIDWSYSKWMTDNNKMISLKMKRKHSDKLMKWMLRDSTNEQRWLIERTKRITLEFSTLFVLFLLKNWKSVCSFVCKIQRINFVLENIQLNAAMLV